MINLTTEQQKKLQSLWDKFKEIDDLYTYEDLLTGEMPTGQKRARTMRFRKYYRYAESLGYDMLENIPQQIRAK